MALLPGLSEQDVAILDRNAQLNRALTITAADPSSGMTAQGLKMLKDIEAERAAQKINETEAKHKRLLTIFELAAVGQPYADQIAARWAAWQKKYQADPAAFDAPSKPAAPTPPPDAQKAPPPSAGDAGGKRPPAGPN